MISKVAPISSIFLGNIYDIHTSYNQHSKSKRYERSCQVILIYINVNISSPSNNYNSSSYLIRKVILSKFVFSWTIIYEYLRYFEIMNDYIYFWIYDKILREYKLIFCLRIAIKNFADETCERIFVFHIALGLAKMGK